MIAAVVLIIWRRPELTRQVFERIREAKPSRLLVIADGPAHDSRCAQSREITSHVDWECKVSTNFSDDHMGLAERMISGLNWAFSVVDEAIILEDDARVSQDFFAFATEMLSRFRSDNRIAQVSALSLSPPSPGGYSYHFSLIPRIWGWASWTSRWARYDRWMESWPETRKLKVLEEILSPKKAGEYTYYFDQTYQPVKGSQSTWDWQWLYTAFMNNWLSVVPTVNLVDNIGFGADATHTRDPHQGDGIAPAGRLQFPLRHADWVVPTRSYDAS